MDDGIYIEIESMEGLKRFVKGAVVNGYLKRVDLREVVEWINHAKYPIRIPIKLDSVLMTGQNAIVKGIFGKNIEATITKYVKEAMENKTGN